MAPQPRHIYNLPEDCISNVLSLTSPRDACRTAAVSTNFRLAADSDKTWYNFLPSDYVLTIAQAVQPMVYESNKELYFRLCDSILIDDGKMIFSIDKETGTKCYELSARKLRINFINSPRYWRWVKRCDSRFDEVAELLAVCGLEVSAKIKTKVLSKGTKYAAYLIFKIADGSYGLRDTQMTLVKVGTYFSQRIVSLQPHVANSGRHYYSRVPKARDDGWMELEMGEFYNDENGEDGDEVEIELRELQRLWWKRGLIIEGIEIKPKS